MVCVGFASTSEGMLAKRSFAIGLGRPILVVETDRRRRRRWAIGTKYGAEVDGCSAGSEVDPWSVRDVDAVCGVVADGGERLFFFLLGTSGKADLYVGIKLRSRGAFRL